MMALNTPTLRKAPRKPARACPISLLGNFRLENMVSSGSSPGKSFVFTHFNRTRLPVFVSLTPCGQMHHHFRGNGNALFLGGTSAGGLPSRRVAGVRATVAGG